MSQRINVAVWGMPQSGKTMALARLATALADSGSAWWFQPSMALEPWIDLNWARIEDQNLFPNPTTADEPLELCFVHGPTGREARVFVHDHPGSAFVNIAAETVEQIAATDAVVLILDPEMNPHHLARYLNQTMRRVHSASASTTVGLDARPFAVCLSQIDRLATEIDQVRRLRDKDAGGEFVEDWVRTHLRDTHVRLSRLLSNKRYFPLSAAGIRINHGVVEPTVFHDEHLRPRVRFGSESLSLLRPLEWIFDQVLGE